MRVSVITVCYNSAATIGAAIDSVLMQRGVDIEHIIVDGASSDATCRVVESRRGRYGGPCELRFVSEPDGGIYDAMNKGIAMATGDVIATLNSDDRYTAPDVLARLTAPLAAGRAEAAYGDVYYHDACGRVTRRYRSRGFRRWMMLTGMMPAHPAFVCLRELFDRYGMYDTSMSVAADFDMMLRMLYVGRVRAEYVDVEAVAMLTGGASTSGWRSHRAIMRDHIRAYRINGVRSNRVLDAMRYPYKLLSLRWGLTRTGRRR